MMHGWNSTHGKTLAPRGAILIALLVMAAALACSDRQQQTPAAQASQNPQAPAVPQQIASIPTSAPGTSAAAPPQAAPSAAKPAVPAPQPKPVSAKAPTQGAGPSLSPAVVAKCLAAKGVTMYGDFRCPHCAEQKAMFGESFKVVPYVECGTPGKPMNLANQAPACRDLGITKYPTWVFPDGERVTNPQSLETLAEKAGCKVR